MGSTENQTRAVHTDGDVLVLAGAGAGKTHTLVERCLDRVLRADSPTSLDRILMVTFTDAAAAEMRARIRLRLQERLEASPADPRLAEQLALLDTAHIGTLHGFCLRLIRDHFHELHLDPQLQVLDETQAHLLATETLDPLLETHYRGATEFNCAVQDLIVAYGASHDDASRRLIRHVHEYSQTLPDPEAWLAAQQGKFEQSQPPDWLELLLGEVARLRDEWLEPLRVSSLPNLRSLAAEFAQLPPQPTREQAAVLLEAILAADATAAWKGKKTAARPEFELFFETAAFLAPLARTTSAPGLAKEPPPSPKGLGVRQSSGALEVAGDKKRQRTGALQDADALHARPEQHSGSGIPPANAHSCDPLIEDWTWLRPHLLTLVALVREFAAAFAAAKRQAAGLDFHDLEQFALRLLWDRDGAPSAIARQWRDRFDFVFVDEYQDINAAQDRIITALSREGTDANRFLVGDVKQCIYGFRRANPRIFQRYADEWSRVRPNIQGSHRSGVSAERRPLAEDQSAAFSRDAATPPRAVIPLADNFRSREAILEFINRVFTPLMRRELGGMVYDEDARLRFGAPGERAALGLDHSPPPAVELLLQVSAPDDETADEELAGLTGLEREARQLALRLRELKESGFQVWDRETKQFRAVRWADMVVLLRSPANKAATFAVEFLRAGVPLSANPGGFYDETEVTDLLCLLQLLDNPLQDVPAIAVLRSPIVGLTLDELALVRLALPHGNFWTALMKFHEAGANSFPQPLVPPPGLGVRQSSGAVRPHEVSESGRGLPQSKALHSTAHAKVAAFLESFVRWRQLARQASLSQCLETILDETHYEDWLLAQDRGTARRANVERLLALTRRFDVFQRQGLHRFQRFVEAQRDAEASPEPAAPEATDAVRLMSIHKSKGLEFPIVAVADLGGRFNLSAGESGVLLDEEFGLCAPVKPPDREQRYPSLPSWLANRRQRREALGEELRLLYVAMTRACDRLILSGHCTESAARKWAGTPDAGLLPATALVSATNALSWLGPLIARATENPHWLDATSGTGRWLNWRLDETTVNRDVDKTPPPAPVEPDEASLDRLKKRIAWRYEHVAATEQPAKGSVTSLRRLLDETDEEARPYFGSRSVGGRRETATGKPSAAAIGSVHHTFLEHVDLAATGDLNALRGEAARLIQQGCLRPDESAALDLHGIAAFWQTDLGRRLRTNAASVQRELEFTARFSAVELAKLRLLDNASDDGEFLVIQGVADLVAVLPEALWLVDFKTDHIEADGVPARMVEHGRQLRVYARALERIYHRPVAECAVYFLALRRLEPVAVGDHDHTALANFAASR